MVLEDGTVTNWYILDVQGVLFLTGDVVEDRKGRWRPGDYMFSSVVMDVDLDAGRVWTRNSVYALHGSGQSIVVSAEVALLMRQGVKLEQAETFVALERQHNAKVHLSKPES